MTSRSRSRTLHTAVIAGVGALFMALSGTGAGAAPTSAPTEQDLANIISEGRQVAGSGSACTSGSGAGSGNGSGDCYGGSGS
ncbi:lipase, partial [Nocardia lasii]